MNYEEKILIEAGLFGEYIRLLCSGQTQPPLYEMRLGNLDKLPLETQQMIKTSREKRREEWKNMQREIDLNNKLINVQIMKLVMKAKNIIGDKIKTNFDKLEA